jgi:hypothetical protein
MTYTYVVLELSPESYKEIRQKLLDAGYANMFDFVNNREVIDMRGIALMKEDK